MGNWSIFDRLGLRLLVFPLNLIGVFLPGQATPERHNQETTTTTTTTTTNKQTNIPLRTQSISQTNLSTVVDNDKILLF